VSCADGFEWQEANDELLGVGLKLSSAIQPCSPSSHSQLPHVEEVMSFLRNPSFEHPFTSGFDWFLNLSGSLSSNQSQQKLAGTPTAGRR